MVARLKYYGGSRKGCPASHTRWSSTRKGKARIDWGPPYYCTITPPRIACVWHEGKVMVPVSAGATLLRQSLAASVLVDCQEDEHDAKVCARYYLDLDQCSEKQIEAYATVFTDVQLVLELLKKVDPDGRNSSHSAHTPRNCALRCQRWW